MYKNAAQEFSAAAVTKGLCTLRADRRITVSIYPAHDWPKIEPLWTNLAENSPHSSFYLSTDWTAAWLEVFGKTLKPRLLVFQEGDQKIGVCLLAQSVERRGPFFIRRIHLNSGGEPKGEATQMEFNNILCRAGKEESISELFGNVVGTLPWDEFVMEGMVPAPVLTALQSQAFHDFAALTRVCPTFHVDLDEIRRTNMSFLDSLSANCRSQIRRSMRRYSVNGAIKTEIAPDLTTAETFFEEMRRMHQARWVARGEKGSFDVGRKLQFHFALIRRAYPKGGIHLLRVRAGTETIGILYNFVQKRKIYFFQSGVHYSLDPRLKPGFVTHACAIQHYLNEGFAEYDFLAGDQRYKRSLANARRSLAWLVFTRPSIKLSVIELLRAIKQSSHSNSFRKKATPSARPES